MMRITTLGLCLSTALLFHCGDDKDSGPSAEALFLAKSGNTTLAGAAQFTIDGDKVKLTLNATGVPQGVHGVHIHEKGDCSSDDAMSAGPHWDPIEPDKHTHGAPSATSHLGDLGNATVLPDGKLTIVTTNSTWSLGDGSPTDVVGKSVVIHANEDDFTGTSGNSGARIGCAVIEMR